MVRIGPERVLLIGDSQKNLQGALTQAMPAAQVTAVPDYFEAIAELAANQYTAVLASAEPIERRPEAAVRTLRQMAADARLVLFGHPTLEPLSRLPQDQQKALKDAASKAESRGWGMSKARQFEANEMLQKNGMTIHEPDAAMKSAFQKVGSQILDEWLKKAGPEGQQLIKTYRGK